MKKAETQKEVTGVKHKMLMLMRNNVKFSEVRCSIISMQF